jgi:hypothetical protein
LIQTADQVRNKTFKWKTPPQQPPSTHSPSPLLSSSPLLFSPLLSAHFLISFSLLLSSLFFHLSSSPVHFYHLSNFEIYIKKEKRKVSDGSGELASEWRNPWKCQEERRKVHRFPFLSVRLSFIFEKDSLSSSPSVFLLFFFSCLLLCVKTPNRQTRPERNID